jgi:hypothetical protein
MLTNVVRDDRGLRTALYVDAGFEFVAGAALIAFASTLGGWFGIPALVCVALGIVFLFAGVVIVLIARAETVDHATVRALAFANVLGGSVGWIVLVAAWPALEPGGRAVLGVAADVFIGIGAWELIELRRVRRA